MSHSPDPFRVQLSDWPKAIAHARPLRELVFVKEQGVALELEWDEWDEPSLHAVAFSPDGTPVGTGRLLPPEGGSARIGRMAVLKPWRGRGAGAAILRALVGAAQDQGMTRIVLHAQTHALGFYEREGFVAEGPEFEEAGIPHLTMMLELPRPAG